MDLIIKTSTDTKDNQGGYPERDNVVDNPAVTKALELVDEAVRNLEQIQDPRYDKTLELLKQAKESCTPNYSQEDKTMMNDVGNMKKEAKNKGKGFMDKIME